MARSRCQSRPITSRFSVGTTNPVVPVGAIASLTIALLRLIWSREMGAAKTVAFRHAKRA